jgi:hypothetical protein
MTTEKRPKPISLTVKGRLITNPTRFFNRNEDGEFDCLVVLEDSDVAKLEAARQQLINEVFEGSFPSAGNDYVIRIGDDKEYQTSYGKKYIMPKSKPTKKGDARKPDVVKKVNGKFEVVSQEEGLFYAGCYVAVNISVYGKPKQGKDVPAFMTTGLKAVMFWKDGEPLGEKFDEDAAFGDLESEITFDDEF